MLRTILFLTATCISVMPAVAREWTDSTGRYKITGDLVAMNADTAVLMKSEKELISVPIAHLSDDDQKFLQEKLDQPKSEDPEQKHLWTMRDGLKVEGRVIGYGKRDVTLQRKRGHIYVNDRLLKNLPAIYQKMLPKIVTHFEGMTIDSAEALSKWVIQQRGKPRTFSCEGVLLELDNGDHYAVPFFFFSEDDLKVLEPGWKSWLSANSESKEREQANLYLEAQSHAYQRNRVQQQQISQLQLALLATEVGATNLWEVQLLPKPGVAAYPQLVVVPARDSGTASAMASRKYAGFQAGAVRRLN